MLWHSHVELEKQLLIAHPRSNSSLCPSEDEVVSMADSTITVDNIEGELLKIERIRDILVRRESELRYM